MNGDDPELATRYVNFSSFLARFVGLRIVNFFDLCPLNAMTFPRGNQMVTRKQEAHAMAASQWILNAAPVLQELCLNNAFTGFA